MALPLGSRTSAVDGSSEGGRVNTVALPNLLVLDGVSLLSRLRAQGYRGKVALEPVRIDGVWGLELTPETDPPPTIPQRWHGHQVVLRLPSG